MSKKLTTFAIVCAVTLGGCATPPVVTDTAVKSFKPINWSCRDTVETRRQIVEHNSVHATLSTGKRTVFKDDCPATKIAKAAP